MRILAALALLAIALPAPAADSPVLPPPAARDTAPDTWAGTDALGRLLPMAEKAGPPRAGHFVAMFYFLWHDASEKQGPFDIARILAADPEARHQPTSPPWGPERAMHHWGEPLFGYYLADDPWIIRKHAQMLSDAGVDVIIFDTSNKLTYRRDYTALMTVYRQMRAEGNRTPQVAFLTPFGDPRSTVRTLYRELYAPGEFAELWFQWEGKPLILADPARVDAEAQAFFTFRKPQPDYFKGPTAPGMWSWLEVYPQHVFRNAAGEKEQMSVGVAQNAVGPRLGSMSEAGARGRSFHDGHLPTSPDEVRYGYNFAEQWERALQEDPSVVFVTGWNEWVAGRFSEFNGIKEPPMFVDTFDQEHSRDIEPMKGGHGDNYYYQLVSYVRRFKGARPVEKASPSRTIRLEPDFTQWAEVGPTYRDDLHDTAHRDHPGFAHAGPYTDASGRNDFDTLKVAHDAADVFFYARTREPITEPAGDDWIVLFIDSDGDHATGWEGYDLMVNRSRSDSDKCSIERNAGGWHWEAAGEARLVRSGSELMIAIPRKLLGAPSASGRVSLDFKWTDHIPLTGDILEFTSRGDAAPNGRFNYRYSE